MNNNHLRTQSTTETTGGRWTSHVDILNSVMDPIDVLSDADLQNELSLYANAQFTFDTLPGVAVGEDKPETVSSFGIYRQPSSHSDTHHHHQQQQHPLSLDIPMATNGTLLNDSTSSTLSSPYDQRQHYFSPLSSVPTSPTKMDKNDERPLDPLLSFMMLSADQQRHHQQDDPASTHLTTSLSATTTNDNLKTPKPDLPPTTTSTTTRKKSASTTRERRAQASKPARPLLEENGTNEADDAAAGEDNDDDADDDDLIKLDKRRRNTAASARFRIKKKMREQSLQRTAYEMTEKAKVLENRVHELEREVKWLKDLIVAKNGS